MNLKDVLLLFIELDKKLKQMELEEMNNTDKYLDKIWSNKTIEKEKQRRDMEFRNNIDQAISSLEKSKQEIKKLHIDILHKDEPELKLAFSSFTYAVNNLLNILPKYHI